MFKDIKAIIFDFNGTMIFDSDIHISVWCEFLNQHLGIDAEYNETKKFVLGRDNASILRHYFGDSLPEERIEELTYEKEAAYRRLCLTDKKRFKFIDGVEDFLDLIVEKNIPRTIATGSEIHNVRFYFEQLGLARWFNFENVIYDDGTFPGKPAPHIYTKAATILGVAPSDCLVFEDSLSGVLAAHNAGIGHVVAISEFDGADFYSSAGGVELASNSFRRFIELFKT